ncbi:MAG: DUF2490 domain-containing protein [Flavobacteriales bacterium]|nr:DUF2490 domain-containing protein [Flavobacteriales bacterium]
MIRTSLFVLVALLSFCFAKQSHAQYHDFGTWTSVGLKQNLKGPFELGLEPQWRTDQGATRTADVIFDLGGTWKAKKWLSFSSTYRFGWQYQLDGFAEMRQRMAFDVKLDRDWREIKFDFRVRYQSGRVASTESFIDFRRAFRAKLGASRKVFKKTEASFACETFFAAGEGTNELTDTRFKFELERKIKKRRYVSMGYQFQNEWNTANPSFEHVLLLNFKMEFK